MGRDGGGGGGGHGQDSPNNSLGQDPRSNGGGMSRSRNDRDSRRIGGRSRYSLPRRGLNSPAGPRLAAKVLHDRNDLRAEGGLPGFSTGLPKEAAVLNKLTAPGGQGGRDLCRD